MKLKQRKTTVLSTTSATIISALDSTKLIADNANIILSGTKDMLTAWRAEVQVDAIDDLIAIGKTKAEATKLIKGA